MKFPCTQINIVLIFVLAALQELEASHQQLWREKDLEHDKKVFVVIQYVCTCTLFILTFEGIVWSRESIKIYQYIIHVVLIYTKPSNHQINYANVM